MNASIREVLGDLSPYIPGKPIEEVKKELGLEDVIKLASNENPLGCSELVRKAIENSLTDLAIYPDGNCTALKEVVADVLGLESEQLLFGAGSDEIIEMIAQTYINPADEAIMAFPSFPRYETVTRIMDGIPVELQLKNHSLDLDAFKSSINEKTKIIWLCNPNNPTGTYYTEEQQLDFLSCVPKNVIVVLDEAYYEYLAKDDYPISTSLLGKYPNIIILRTFSKAYGLASLRIGYAIASKEIISYLNRVRGPFNVNRLAQIAAIAALLDKDFLEMSICVNNQGKKQLYDAFDEMRLEYIPTEGNFVMVNVGMSSGLLFGMLLKRGIIVRTGDVFKMDEWIRVTIGTQEQNKYFLECLKDILCARAGL